MSQHVTTAAGIEAQTSTSGLAQEVHRQADNAKNAAEEAAATARSVPSHPAAQPAGSTTTAANVEAQAPTQLSASQIRATAGKTQSAAEEAAATAHTKGPKVTGNAGDAVTQLEENVKVTTDAAVAQGQHDVHAAAAAGSGYLDQAKHLAASAFATAQSYLPASTAGSKPNPAATTQAHSITETLGSTVSSATETAKGYLASAQVASQPHVEQAKVTLAHSIESAKDYLGGEHKPAGSSGIPPTTAPLESGPHTTTTPYPSTTKNTLIGENEKKKSI